MDVQQGQRRIVTDIPSSPNSRTPHKRSTIHRNRPTHNHTHAQTTHTNTQPQPQPHTWRTWIHAANHLSSLFIHFYPMTPLIPASLCHVMAYHASHLCSCWLCVGCVLVVLVVCDVVCCAALLVPCMFHIAHFQCLVLCLVRNTSVDKMHPLE